MFLPCPVWSSMAFKALLLFSLNSWELMGHVTLENVEFILVATHGLPMVQVVLKTNVCFFPVQF
eukprot:c2829_g2_i1 orf=211-402(+)